MKRIILPMSALVVGLSGCQTIGMDLPTRLNLTYNNIYLKKPHIKAYAIARGMEGGYSSGYTWHELSVKSAIEAALEQCNQGKQSHAISTPCAIYSIGALNIERMTKNKQDKAIEFYGQNNSATNETFEAFLKSGETLTSTNASSETSVIPMERNFSDMKICREAMDSSGKYFTRITNSPFLKSAIEARRRNFTPVSCALLLKKTTENNSSLATPIIRPERDYSDNKLCWRALKFSDSEFIWNPSQTYQRSVQEAKRRNWTPEGCALLLDRTIKNTLPTVSADQLNTPVIDESEEAILKRQLKTIKELLESGLITKEEAAEKRKLLLDQY